MHLLSGDAVPAMSPGTAREAEAVSPQVMELPTRTLLSADGERLKELEAEVSELRRELETLRQQFANFQKQFQ